MLRCAQHLAADRDRPFAEFTLSEANGLRVTGCDSSHGQGLVFTIEPCLRKPTLEKARGRPASFPLLGSIFLHWSGNLSCRCSSIPGFGSSFRLRSLSFSGWKLVRVSFAPLFPESSEYCLH